MMTTTSKEMPKITMLAIRMMKAMHIGPFSFALSAFHSSSDESQIKRVAAAEKTEDWTSWNYRSCAYKIKIQGKSDMEQVISQHYNTLQNQSVLMIGVISNCLRFFSNMHCCSVEGARRFLLEMSTNLKYLCSANTLSKCCKSLENKLEVIRRGRGGAKAGS